MQGFSFRRWSRTTFGLVTIVGIVFALTTLAAVPGILMVVWLMKRFPHEALAQRGAGPVIDD